MTQNIELSKLHPHSKNPRFAPRQDVVDQIAAQIEASGNFDEAHALIVRPNAKGFEIISGHHRVLAATKAKLKSVPCWVREMSDEDAYMALVLANAQGELHPLEEGMHAIGSELTLKEYAIKIGMNAVTLQHRWQAATVAKNIAGDISVLCNSWYHLNEIYVAFEWLWPALVDHVMKENLTREKTRKVVAQLKDIKAPPPWAAVDAVAKALVADEMRSTDVKRMADTVEKTRSELMSDAESTEKLTAKLDKILNQKRPASLSDVQTICDSIIQEQAEILRERQRQDEDARRKTKRLKTNVSLEEWKTLKDKEKELLLNITPDDIAPGIFNEQGDNPGIEWARWSWNPITGCNHGCPYCYAREMAESARYAKAYPYGFAPAFRPAMLMAPRAAKLPPEAKKDERFKNVFTCSMADLFGRWVPAEWIEAVLNEMRNASQWNFLCLTKFPKRMAEFDIPDNAWMGTTVDLQARVPNAEAAFAKIKCKTKWLSIEPMLEPLKFKRLDLFNWIVIGGSTPSTNSVATTPEWKPPFEWILDLLAQAREAKCAVYFKPNLLGRRLLELPDNMPIETDNVPAPKEFKYLGKTKQSSIEE